MKKKSCHLSNMVKKSLPGSLAKWKHIGDHHFLAGADILPYFLNF